MTRVVQLIVWVTFSARVLCAVQFDLISALQSNTRVALVRLAERECLDILVRIYLVESSDRSTVYGGLTNTMSQTVPSKK